MSQFCARCNKVVYPTEKVNCLDQVCLARFAPPRRRARLPGVLQD